jgi:hypothetical protein
MRPNKIGQVAKFHTPLPGKNANQLYVVLDIIEDVNGKEHTVTLCVNEQAILCKQYYQQQKNKLKITD